MVNVVMDWIELKTGEAYHVGEHYESAFIDNYSVHLRINGKEKLVVQKSAIKLYKLTTLVD